MNERQRLLNQHIKSKKFEKIYFFYGQERFLIDYYTNNIPKMIVNNNENILIFDGEDANYDEVVNELFSFSFASISKVFVFKNFIKNANKIKLETILKQLEQTNDGNIIIFKEYEINNSSYVSKIKPIAFWVEFEKQLTVDLIKWVQNIFNKENKQISENMAEEIINHFDRDMYTIYNYLNILISYLGGKNKPSYEDIRLFMYPNPQDRIFLMLDAFSQKDIEKGFEYLNQLYELKESSLRILFMINRHFKILGILKDSLQDKRTIIKTAGIKEYFYDKYKKQADQFTIEKIKNIIQKSVEIDYLIKTGQLQQTLGIETLIYEIIK
ncbi:DNA polymerase III subunit delta [Caldicellulosiruptoraceae bacterium PP1]